MAQDDPFIARIYRGLQVFSDSSFPKQCSRCARRFESVSQFLRETEGIHQGSGLRESRDDEDRPVVELFRNCPCGSTLMEIFGDRRDMSAAGIRRRRKFRELLDILVADGMDPETARTELLKVLRGQDSPLLRERGIDPALPS